MFLSLLMQGLILRLVRSIPKHQSFTTVDIIRMIFGHFYRAVEQPPSNSINAIIGKFIKKHCSVYHVDSLTIDDDHGFPTTTAVFVKH